MSATQTPSHVIDLVESLGGGPELYAALDGFTPEQVAEVARAASEAAQEAAKAARLRHRKDVPLVECKPWCIYGDGHPGEWTREDQWCSTTTHLSPASLMPEEEWTDGVMRRPTIEVTGQQVPDEEPVVTVDLSGDSLLRLTLDEAQMLAAHLTDVCGEVTR